MPLYSKNAKILIWFVVVVFVGAGIVQTINYNVWKIPELEEYLAKCMAYSALVLFPVITVMLGILYDVIPRFVGDTEHEPMAYVIGVCCAWLIAMGFEGLVLYSFDPDNLLVAAAVFAYVGYVLYDLGKSAVYRRAYLINFGIGKLIKADIHFKRFGVPISNFEVYSESPVPQEYSKRTKYKVNIPTGMHHGDCVSFIAQWLQYCNIEINSLTENGKNIRIAGTVYNQDDVDVGSVDIKVKVHRDSMTFILKPTLNDHSYWTILFYMLNRNRDILCTDYGDHMTAPELTAVIRPSEINEFVRSNV